MPEDLVRSRCDLPEVRWEPIEKLANDFQVSLMAAARRFVAFTDDRVAVVCCKDGKIAWSDGNRSFGKRPKTGAEVDQWSLAYDYFAKGNANRRRETVSANAWIPVREALGVDESVSPEGAVQTLDESNDVDRHSWTFVQACADVKSARPRQIMPGRPALLALWRTEPSLPGCPPGA
jgi:hypothetical protein